MDLANEDLDQRHQLLAAYAENRVTQEERMAVRRYLAENPDEMASVLMMMDTDYDITLDKGKERTMGSDFLHRLDTLADSLDISTSKTDKAPLNNKKVR